jgi:hypothetical protein
MTEGRERWIVPPEEMRRRLEQKRSEDAPIEVGKLAKAAEVPTKAISDALEGRPIPESQAKKVARLVAWPEEALTRETAVQHVEADSQWQDDGGSVNPDSQLDTGEVTEG